MGILCQKRILTAWINGGGGIINRTISSPEIRRYTEQILKHYNWNGHLEIDWIHSKTENTFLFLGNES